MKDLTKRLLHHRLLWPLVCLLALLALNLLRNPDFLALRVSNGHLHGSLVDICRYGSPLVLIALGMTLVIATKGIDLSVGSVVAIGGAFASWQISQAGDQNDLSTVLVAVGTSLLLAVLLGLWNGGLVAFVGIQPIIATLILMVAGRGIAQLITGGQIITTNSDPYHRLGGGYVSLVPFPIVIAAGVFALAALATRRTALGMLLESVGGNAEASRLAGVGARSVVLAAYAFSGLCSGLAGLLVSANVSAADGNNAGLWIELDAIAAVVIGGTLLTGGRFSLVGTLLGALVIQTLSTTVYSMGIPPETSLVFKAVVVFAVVLLQSPDFRERMFRRGRRAHVRPPHGETVEVPA